MNRFYRNTEVAFEKLTAGATFLLGNSITFIIAVGLVLFWLINKQFLMQDGRDCIRDIIHGITFLSLFIIQKSFNRFAASLHLKVNELVTSHDSARNAVIDMGEKTEHEIVEFSKEYVELAKEGEEPAVRIILESR